MRTRTSALAAVVALAALVGGCATGSSTASGTSPTAAPPSPADTASRPATAEATGIPRIHLGDKGSTVRIELGGTAVLFLPTADWTWSDPRSDSPVVSISEDVSDAGSASRSWTLTARERGEATVTATGTPTCRDDDVDPCTTAPTSFTVAVVVP